MAETATSRGQILEVRSQKFKVSPTATNFKKKNKMRNVIDVNALKGIPELALASSEYTVFTAQVK